MTAEALFSACNLAVVPGWLLLAAAPRWRWTERLVLSGLVPLLLGLVYLYLILAHWGSAEGGFGSLAEVRRLFGRDELLLAGWVHYLAFDLFVGAWEVRDARRRSVPHLLVIPCLVLTFLFGPIGLLLYAALRAAVTRRPLFDATGD